MITTVLVQNDFYYNLFAVGLLTVVDKYMYINVPVCIIYFISESWCIHHCEFELYSALF